MNLYLLTSPVTPFQLRLWLCHLSPHFPFDFTAHGAVCTRLASRDVSRLRIKGKEFAPENTMAVMDPTEDFIRCIKQSFTLGKCLYLLAPLGWTGTGFPSVNPFGHTMHEQTLSAPRQQSKLQSSPRRAASPPMGDGSQSNGLCRTQEPETADYIPLFSSTTPVKWQLWWPF